MFLRTWKRSLLKVNRSRNHPYHFLTTIEWKYFIWDFCVHHLRDVPLEANDPRLSGVALDNRSNLCTIKADFSNETGDDIFQFYPHDMLP